MHFISEVNLVNWLKQHPNGFFHTRDHSTIFYDHDTFVCLTGYQQIIDHFFHHQLPNFKSPVVIIIIETDFYHLNNVDLENPLIKHIFTWNNPVKHPKITTLPIGLNHYSHEGALYNFLSNYGKKSRTDEYWLGYNFRPHTPLRKQLLKYLQGQSFCHNLPSTPPFNEYWKRSCVEGEIRVAETHVDCYKEMSKCKYIISPPGVGVDCHRTWEALYLGCIPIVESSTISEIYEDLPILVVDNWHDLSLDMLEHNYNKIKNSEFNMDKLYLEYWTNQISDKFTEEMNDEITNCNSQSR